MDHQRKRPVVSIQQILLAAASAAGWSPLSLSPPIWLDDDSSVVGSTNASSWSNRGSIGGAAEQPDGLKQPVILAANLNGRRVLSFDGIQDTTSDKMSVTGSTSVLQNVGAAACFAVVKKRGTDVGGYRSLLTILGNDADWRFGSFLSFTPVLNKASLYIRRVNADTPVLGSSTTGIDGTWNLVWWIQDYAAGAGKVIVNGTTEFDAPLGTAGNTTNSAGSTGVIIGGNAGDTLAADVDLAAIGVLNALPTTDQIQRTEGWAAHRYGLTANLPSGHPYKTVAP